MLRDKLNILVMGERTENLGQAPTALRRQLGQVTVAMW